MVRFFTAHVVGVRVSCPRAYNEAQFVRPVDNRQFSNYKNKLLLLTSMFLFFFFGTVLSTEKACCLHEPATMRRFNINNSMSSKGDRLRTLYAENHSPIFDPPPNNSQETHSRRLQADLARTKTFIRQADDAIEQLSKSLGPLADKDPDTSPSILPPGWSSETWKLADLVALHEVYRQLPYTPMKNDLIEIASAVKLTLDTVREQRETSELLAAHNETSSAEVKDMHAIYSDLQEMESALAARVSHYPQKLATLERKIQDSGSFSQEVERKIDSVAQVLHSAKMAEERMYGHLQRVVMKLHALVDWENANMMDETTFRNSIASSVALISSMVQKLMENGGDSEANWVPVLGDVTEVRLIEVMIRNNVFVARGGNDHLEIKLLDLGQ